MKIYCGGFAVTRKAIGTMMGFFNVLEYCN